jgi:hypothetical protein
MQVQCIGQWNMKSQKHTLSLKKQVCLVNLNIPLEATFALKFNTDKQIFAHVSVKTIPRDEIIK